MKFLLMFGMVAVPSGVGWQKDNTVEVSFVADPNAVCGPHPIPCWVILACVDEIGGKKMVLPNPCLYKDKDNYARLVCHELAHTNHWRHEYK